MRLIYLESPLMPKARPGSRAYDREFADNQRFARRCVLDCLRRGEAPFASHLLYAHPDILDDSNPMERGWGMEAGFAWANAAEKTVVYQDRGISRGMQAGIERAESAGRPVEYRRLTGDTGPRGPKEH